MAYAFLTDLFRQVANVLLPAHGGTGSTHGEARVVVQGFNRTGGDLPLYTLVQWANVISKRVDAVTALDSTDVLGVVVGYYDLTGLLVEADAPDNATVAVQTAGVAKVLIESVVAAGDYAFAAATDGTMYSDPTLATGAFGVVMQNGDTGEGITEIEVQFPLLNASAGGGGGSFGTPALTLSTTNAAGAASTGIRTDATVAVFDATVPVTQAFGDAAAAGSAGVTARRDHKHGMPASGVPAFATPSVVLGAAAAAGAAGTVIRSDATIQAFDATVPTTQAFGDAAATGAAAVAARRDHKHGMPASLKGGIDVVVSAPVAGVVCDIEMPYDGTFTSWRVFNDAAGSIQYDLWNDVYTAYPPVVGDSITAADKPKTTTAAKAESSGVPAWSGGLAFDAGDIIRVNIDSTSGLGRSVLSLRYTRT